MCCFILHNFCVRKNIPLLTEEPQGDETVPNATSLHDDHDHDQCRSTLTSGPPPKCLLTGHITLEV